MVKLTTDLNQLETYLHENEWIQKEEHLQSAEKPGEGNMNFTLRLKTNRRTLIIKQSREYVEKYPQVPAPQERILMEAAFYELIAANSKLKSAMPEVFALDRKNHVLLMEDLGEGKDYTFLYQRGKTLSERELQKLVDFLSRLHLNFKVSSSPNRIRNLKMRKLNHQHIFELPYAKDNGFNLDELIAGLHAAAEPLKKDEKLIREVKKLGAIYLSDGEHLLHGDFFPGSWLKTKDGLNVIDPEFCFFGSVEFEVGVTLAHLKMSEQPEELQLSWLEKYQSKAPLDELLCKKFAAIEVIRRIIGLAQLPLSLNLKQRQNLLAEAHALLISE